MAVSDNPHRSRVKLDPKEMTITIEIVKREDDSVVETGVYKAGEVAENLRPQVSLYGLSKLLQDRASDVPVGPGKIAAMNDLMEQFRNGTWSAERTPGAPVVSAEVEALAAIKGVSVAVIQNSLRQYPVEVRKNILANAAVVAKAAEIRSARGEAKPVDLGDLTA
jgi:hypothetical protein